MKLREYALNKELAMNIIVRSTGGESPVSVRSKNLTKKMTLVMYPLLAVFFVGLGITFIAMSLTAIGVVMIVLGVLLPFFGFFIMKFTGNMVKKRMGNMAQQFTLTDDGVQQLLTTAAATVNRSFRWDDVRAAAEKQNEFEIFFARFDGILLPKDGFVQGTTEELTAFLQQRLGGKFAPFFVAKNDKNN